MNVWIVLYFATLWFVHCDDQLESRQIYHGSYFTIARVTVVDKVSYFDVLVQHSWLKLRKTTTNNGSGCCAGKNTCANDVPRALEPMMQKSCKSAGKRKWFRLAPRPVMWHQRWQGVSQEILCADATGPQGVWPPAQLVSTRSAVDVAAGKGQGEPWGMDADGKQVATGVGSSLFVSLQHACNMKKPRWYESRRKPTPLHNRRWRNGRGENSSAPFGMWWRYANISLMWRWKDCGRLSVSSASSLHSTANILTCVFACMQMCVWWCSTGLLMKTYCLSQVWPLRPLSQWVILYWLPAAGWTSLS